MKDLPALYKVLRPLVEVCPESLPASTITMDFDNKTIFNAVQSQVPNEQTHNLVREILWLEERTEFTRVATEKIWRWT